MTLHFKIKKSETKELIRVILYFCQSLIWNNDDQITLSIEEL